MKYFLLSISALLLACPSSAAELPTITSSSTSAISVISDIESQATTVALYGENLDYILFNDVEVRLGSVVGTVSGGNSTGISVSFTIAPTDFTNYQSAAITVQESGSTIATGPSIRINNPLQTDYQPRKTKKFLKNTTHKKANKRTVGLNVHWALGADTSEDSLFAEKLDNSNTKWAREHISFAEIMGDDSDAWLTRYDNIFYEYQKRNMRVVVMLAYGDGSDRFVPPSTKRWKQFVRTVVKRYRNNVDAWEVWNEPDSDSYMHPSTVSAVHPLQKASYPLIKHYAPQSIVLNGPIGDIQHTRFIENLYKKSGKYFDQLSVHLYYCDEYVHNGNNGALRRDVDALFAAIPKNQRNKRIWVTELGCSRGTSGVDESLQRRYLKKATQLVLKTKKFQNVLLYTIRDRPYLGTYEANFGLMDASGANHPAWKWYRQLPRK